MKFTAICENHLFRRTYQSGERKSARTLSVCILRDRRAKQLAARHPQRRIVNRIGISASKKIGGAVARNRAKRVVREAYRQIDREYGIRTGWLIVLTPYPSAAHCRMQEVRRDMLYCFRSLSLLADPGPEKTGAPAPAADGGASCGT